MTNKEKIMKTMQIESNSSTDTKKIAQRLAQKLSKGDVVVLTGELRSWKNKIYRRIFIILWNRK